MRQPFRRALLCNPTGRAEANIAERRRECLQRGQAASRLGREQFETIRSLLETALKKTKPCEIDLFHVFMFIVLLTLRLFSIRRN